MAENQIPPTERIATAFKQLAAASLDVNLAAKDLGASISNLESTARLIDVQVSAWHPIASHDDTNGGYWSRDIGWAKVKNQWCITIRKISGHHAYDEHQEEVWTFADAPRWMAIESAGKLPDLFETLVKRSLDTRDKLQARKVEADQLAAAIEAIMPEICGPSTPKKKGRW